MLKKLLAHPLVLHANLDDPSTIGLQKQVLNSKPFLKQLYQEWYQLLAAEFSSDQQVLEIGAGPGFLKEHLHNSIRSEILPVPDSDLVLDARHLPLKDNSLDGIVMTNVLHHVQDCSAFFNEATRAVRPGGKLVMIEPWNNPWARLIYNHLHHEPFLPEADDWELAAGGPLSAANGALPWIILVRDRERFAEQHPEWHLHTLTPLMPFAYILSGGLSQRSLLPGSTYPFIRWLEKKIGEKYWGMFVKICLTRRFIT